MMKILLYIFLLFPFLAVCQEAKQLSKDKVKEEIMNNETKKERNSATSISNNFSAPAIVAYQDKAIAHIKDFYNYINLYNNSETSPELQAEIDSSIKNLFIQGNIQLKDIFEENSQSLTLQQFLLKCKQNKISITANDFSQKLAEADNYFTFQYTLQIIQNSKTMSFPINQKVYLFPSVKQFGTDKKNVWQMKLGEF